MGKKLPVITILPTSYDGVVSRYIVEKRPTAQKEREFYFQLPTVEGGAPGRARSDAGREAALSPRSVPSPAGNARHLGRAGPDESELASWSLR